MSLTQTAILASAIRPKSDKPSETSQTFAQSVATRPIQYLLVVGAIVYFGGKFLKGVIPTGENLRKDQAETSTSKDNPFSYQAFLTQKNIPKNTNLITAAGAYKYAKQVYEALNVYIDENEDVAIGVFKVIPSKIQMAQVAQSFYNYYKIDILSYIKNGNEKNKFRGGLSENDYNLVLANVNKKPKF